MLDQISKKKLSKFLAIRVILVGRALHCYEVRNLQSPKKVKGRKRPGIWVSGQQEAC